MAARGSTVAADPIGLRGVRSSSMETKTRFADEDCAQALLDLARSTTPMTQMTITRRNGNQSLIRSPVKRTLSGSGPAVTVLHHPNKRLRAQSWSQSTTSTVSAETVLELNQCIRLDHSYASPCTPKLHIGEPAVAPRSRYASESTSNRRGAVSLLNKKDSLLHLLNDNNEEQPSPIGEDLYEAEDSKYKKFNLLLKCLTNADDLSLAVATQKDEVRNEPGRTRHDSNIDDLSGSSEDSGQMQTHPLDSEPYSCKKCLKTFCKKRYLMKHIQRMHPKSGLYDAYADQLVCCPNCDYSISKKNFKRHASMCKNKKQQEMDLANCQFCPVRMRRHMLVKHLAQEHCVDKDLLEDDSLSKSDLSSESEQEPVLCGVCNDVVRRGVLKQHILSFHVRQNPRKPTAPCIVCSIELPQVELVHHIATEHAWRIGDAGQTRVSKHRCKHSMLQRFLNDSSGETPQAEEEQCQACVGSLVRQDSEVTLVNTPTTTVPGNSNNAAAGSSREGVREAGSSSSGGAQPTQLTCTLTVHKDPLQRDSPPKLVAPPYPTLRSMSN